MTAQTIDAVESARYNAARMLTYDEAVALLKVHKRTIDRRVAAGRYTVYGEGRAKRILYRSILADIKRASKGAVMAKKRRPRGTGRVYEFPKGSDKWWAQLPERNGKSGPRWRVKNQAEGDETLAAKLHEMQQGIKVYARADTFGDLVMACIDRAANIGPTTRETYRQHARLYVLSQPIAKIRVADLDVADVRDWLADVTKIRSERTKKRLSGRIIRRAYERIRVALLIAFEDRRISWLPPRTLKLPPVVEVEKRALTLDECNRLIAAATNERLALMYKTFIATGMRESELIGLMWDMIDWDRSEITLTSQLKRVREDDREERRWMRLPLKNRQKRTISLDGELLSELRHHRTRQMAEKLRRGPQWQDNGLVFPTGTGRPFNPRNLIDDVQHDAGKAGIGKITVHELRHTAGSLMLAAGKTMTVVAKVLGHSSVGVTEKIYAHAYEDDKRDAVASVTRRLRRVGGAE